MRNIQRKSSSWMRRILFYIFHRVSLKQLFYGLLFLIFIYVSANFFRYTTEKIEDDFANELQDYYSSFEKTEIIRRPQYYGPADVILRSQYFDGNYEPGVINKREVHQHNGPASHVEKRSVEEEEDDDIIDSSEILNKAGRATVSANTGAGSGDFSGSGETTTELPTTAFDTTTIHYTTTDVLTTDILTTAAVTCPTCPNIPPCPVQTTVPCEVCESVPLWAIAAIIVALLFGILITLLCCFCCMRRSRRRKRMITPITTPYSSQDQLRDIEEAKELDDHTDAIISRVDMINRALVMGSPIILEFAINEARSKNLHRTNGELITQAESKLYQWKRVQSGLNVALLYHDEASMIEYMDRFDKQGMKDDTGVYKRCQVFRDDLNKTRSVLDHGVTTRDETLLGDTIAAYGLHEIPKDQSENDKSLKNAILMKEELRQERLLKGRTQEEYRQALREAIFTRDADTISAAVVAFKEAEIPDTNDDLISAATALQDIEDERKVKQKESYNSMVEACQTRDQNQLRESLEECKKWGVPTADIEAGEDLLPTIVKEDQLLAELDALIEEEDMQKLADALIIYKSPALKLTDKTGSVAAAEKVLLRLQEKDRMRRTKGDVMWRLQAAMAVGDVTAMDGMIKALEALASAGEDIPEAFLLRARDELDRCRGQVDYRKRMEAIKSAIGRAITAGDIEQLDDLIDQMAILAEDEEYTMTSDDTRVLDSARAELNTLKNKAAIRQEIEQVKPELGLRLIPGNVGRLRAGVDRLGEAKEQSEPYPGLFTEEDETLLQDNLVTVEDLERKVKITEEARTNLNQAVDERVFVNLRSAIKQAHAAPFIERDELVEPIQLAKFLDPRERKVAVRRAWRDRDIKALENALSDFAEAGVEDDKFESKAHRVLEQLKEREVHRQKKERQKELEDEKRREDIQRLTSMLSSAMQSRDVEQLQLALEEFEDSGYDEEDVPIFIQAEQLYDNLKISLLKEKLLDGIERRDVKTLEEAVDETELGGYIIDINDEYKLAKDLLTHLQELIRLREAISEMNRSLISEIHKYPQPPVSVHTVMMATFVLLGEKPKTVKNWQEVQALLGKLGQNSITRRVRVCTSDDISARSAKKVTEMLKNIKLDEIGEISKGAATFYAWTMAMIKESQYADNIAAAKDLEHYDVLVPQDSNKPITVRTAWAI